MPRILVVRFSSLGDVILTTPVYRNLKTHWPRCTIAVAVKDSYQEVLSGNPYIDEIIPLKKGTSIFRYIQKIREKDYDILIDLHNNLRSRILGLFCGIKKRVHYKKALLARRLLVLKKIKSKELESHTLQRYLDCLKILGLVPQEYPPEIFKKDSVSVPAASLHILVVQTAFLGDAILTTPMFTHLKAQFPTAQITLLCTPEIKDIFLGNPAIHEVLIYDKKGRDKGLFSFWRWRKLLRGKYDVALLPHRSFRSALLIWLSQIPKRIGFDRSEGRFLLTDVIHFDWNSHDSTRNLHLLKALGIATDSQAALEIPLERNKFHFEDFLKEHSIPKDTLLVGINPGSVWKTKRYLPEYFAQVADTLTREWKCQIILFGSAKDLEAAAAVTRDMKTKGINLCGRTNLKQLTALVSHLSLFITNDSGPMHLACALKIPVVAIFGPTTRELGFFPLGEKSKVVELDLPCRPCSLHGGNVCPLDHFKCMRDLSPETVLKACEIFL